MDMFSATNRDTYEKRKIMVAEKWAEYQKDKNPLHLASICRELSFFDHPQVGEEIARLLLAEFYQELGQSNQFMKLMFNKIYFNLELCMNIY